MPSGRSNHRKRGNGTDWLALGVSVHLASIHESFLLENNPNRDESWKVLIETLGK